MNFEDNESYDESIESTSNVNHRFKHWNVFWSVYNGLVVRPTHYETYVRLCAFAQKSDKILTLPDEYSQAAYMKGLIGGILAARPELN